MPSGENVALPDYFPIALDWKQQLEARYSLMVEVSRFYAAARAIGHVAAALAALNDRKNLHTQFLTQPEYFPEWLDEDQSQTVYFDIETYDQNKETHFGLGVTINAAGEVCYWDKTDLPEMVDYLLKYKQIVSYNGQKFDIPVLCQEINDLEKAQALFNRSFDAIWLVNLMEGEHLFALKALAERVLHLDASYFSAHLSKNIPALILEGTEEALKEARLHCYKDVGLLIRVIQYYSLTTDKKIRIFDENVIENIHKIINLAEDWLSSIFSRRDDDPDVLVVDVFKENEAEIVEIENLLSMIEALPANFLSQARLSDGYIDEHITFIKAYRKNPAEFDTMTLDNLMYWHYIDHSHVYNKTNS